MGEESSSTELVVLAIVVCILMFAGIAAVNALFEAAGADPP